MNDRVLRGLLTAWLLCLSLPPAIAQADGWGISQLMHGLAHGPHETARFAEQKYIGVLDTPILSSGRLKYVAPDYLEKHTTSPKDERMVLDGDVLTLTQDDKTYTLRLSEQPAAVAYANSIRGLLSGNLSVLRQSYDLQLTGDRQSWTLLLHPTNPQVVQLIDSISVTGSGTRIRTIEYDQSDGDRTVMTIKPAQKP